MYNEEQKIKFIQSYTDSISNRQSAVALFNRFEKYENEWNADLCTRSREELEPIMSEVAGVRGNSQIAMLTILKGYVKWCITMNIPDVCDGALQVEVSGLDKIRSQMVSNPLHLHRCLNGIFDSESEETIDNIYRCYFWMAYGGIKEEDVVQVRNDDVDFENMVIKYKNTSIPIYLEALPAFKKAVNLNSFLYKNHSYNESIRRDRIFSNLVMRGIRAIPKTSTLRVHLSKKNINAIKEGKTEIKLTFDHVYLSGLFYRVYELERAGVPVDFSEAADRAMDGKIYTTKRQWKKRVIERNYMEDYQRWKLAFST